MNPLVWLMTVPVGVAGEASPGGAGIRTENGLRNAIGVVDGRVAAVVVGDPERLAGEEGNSPGIDEFGVGVVGHTGHVRNQIRLLIGIGLRYDTGDAERNNQAQN